MNQPLRTQLVRSLAVTPRKTVEERIAETWAKHAGKGTFTQHYQCARMLANDSDLIAEFLWDLPAWPDDRDFEEALEECGDLIAETAKHDAQRAKLLVIAETALSDLVDEVRFDEDDEANWLAGV